MKVLVEGAWDDGFLDYHRSPAEYRIDARAWCNLSPVEGLYFEPERSARLIWNYLFEVGPRGVLRKVISRRRERYRNRKFLSCGLGKVLEGPARGAYRPDDPVAFLAPSHPACVERCVLPEALLRHADAKLLVRLSEDEILHLAMPLPADLAEGPVATLAGWSAHSGRSLEKEAAGSLARALDELVARIPWDRAAHRWKSSNGGVGERTAPATGHRKAGRPRAVLFGYGHYAKTAILPNLSRHLEVDEIHEIDPLQIGPVTSSAPIYDTSPDLRGDDDHDVVLVAGYHHTHAPVAIEALRRGAYVVVEKPLAVDREQLGRVEDAIAEFGRKLFVCFQRRYLPLNDYVREDLRVGEGDPVSYHCIVYHVPLPERHWYRWPSVKTRIVSNGCHWIDHFLFLNDFAPPSESDLTVGPHGEVTCSVSLVNGAYFTMTMTEQGSKRIGVQEHVELRVGDATARIVNGSAYVAEDGRRVLRRKRINKLGSYEAMYAAIGQTIAAGGVGDSLVSVTASTRLILALDEKFRRAAARAGVAA